MSVASDVKRRLATFGLPVLSVRQGKGTSYGHVFVDVPRGCGPLEERIRGFAAEVAGVKPEQVHVTCQTNTELTPEQRDRFDLPKGQILKTDDGALAVARVRVERIKETIRDLHQGPRLGEPLSDAGLFSVLSGRDPEEAVRLLRPWGAYGRWMEGGRGHSRNWPDRQQIIVPVRGGVAFAVTSTPAEEAEHERRRERYQGNVVASPMGWQAITILPLRQIGGTAEDYIRLTRESDAAQGVRTFGDGPLGLEVL